MIRDLGRALVILCVSSVAAVGANLLREKPLDWIRKPLPAPKPAAEAVLPAPAPAVDAAVPAAPAAGSTAAPPVAAAGGLDIDALLAHLGGGTAYFVDARERDEYVAGHLRGAFHLPASAIYQNIESVRGMIPPGAKVIVYCGGGDCEASHHVHEALVRDFGFTDVTIYDKGWAAVEASGRFKEFIQTGEQP
jgi:rhodanese-related sulfurtransferase